MEMVAAIQHNYARSKAMLALYVLASLCINVLLCQAADFTGSARASLPDMQLRINLMSMAAPAVIAPLPAPEVQAAEVAPLPPVEPVRKAENMAFAAKPETLAKLAPSAAPKEIKEPAVEQKQMASLAVLSDAGRDVSSVIPIVTDAEYRRSVPPVYPARAVERGQQGTVLLHALVSPEGTTEHIKIAQSSGFGLLDKAALAAVQQWEFAPSSRNGNHIKSWVQVPVEFVLQP